MPRWMRRLRYRTLYNPRCTYRIRHEFDPFTSVYQQVADQVRCDVYAQVRASVWDQVSGWETLTSDERRMLGLPDA